MKKNGLSQLLAIGIVFCWCFQAVAESNVHTYPAPESQAVNDVYSVKVNGKSVDVYSAQYEFGGDYYFANFDFSGKISVEVTSTLPMEKAKVLPDRFGIQLKKTDAKTVVFETDKPFKISLETNGRMKPLLLFGNEMETDIPDPKSPNVLYYGPGVHKADKITLKSNQTLYLAGGALLKAGINAEGENITIRGRGILAGEDSPRFKGPGRFPLDCRNCKNLSVRDITIRNTWSWSFVVWNCEGVLIDNVKICASRMINDDALDLVNTQNAVVRNCFFRTQDDSIAIKGIDAGMRACENIRIENCQFWTEVANIFRIGYECDTTGMRNITAKSIDVLHYSKNYNEPTAYWANAVIWLQPNIDMVMEQCHFDDIVVYSDENDIIMLMAKPMRCEYGKYKDPEPGSLKNCTFKNIRVVGTQGKFNGLIYIWGDSEKHNVDGLTFENIDYFGKPIHKDSPNIKTGPFSTNIQFK